jgi:hypothetical protein
MLIAIISLENGIAWVKKFLERERFSEEMDTIRKKFLR